MNKISKKLNIVNFPNIQIIIDHRVSRGYYNNLFSISIKKEIACVSKTTANFINIVQNTLFISSIVDSNFR